MRSAVNAQLGIWIDRKQAIIVSVMRDRTVVTKLRSSLRSHGRYHGTHDSGGERKYEARHEQELAHYLDAVARHVERGDEVLILGPGETKRALARRMDQIKSLTGVTTKAAAADKISDADLVATIRKRYRLPV
jgi:DeoR/GlpR family transcriptional regulator of sugar metabolism